MKITHSNAMKKGDKELLYKFEELIIANKVKRLQNLIELSDAKTSTDMDYLKYFSDEQQLCTV